MTTNLPLTAFNLESILDDESLVRIRRAYHELEAFRLSERHQVMRDKLERLISHHSGEVPENDDL